MLLERLHLGDQVQGTLSIPLKEVFVFGLCVRPLAQGPFQQNLVPIHESCLVHRLL